MDRPEYVYTTREKLHKMIEPLERSTLRESPSDMMYEGLNVNNNETNLAEPSDEDVMCLLTDFASSCHLLVYCRGVIVGIRMDYLFDVPNN